MQNKKKPRNITVLCSKTTSFFICCIINVRQKCHLNVFRYSYWNKRYTWYCDGCTLSWKHRFIITLYSLSASNFLWWYAVKDTSVKESCLEECPEEFVSTFIWSTEDFLDVGSLSFSSTDIALFFRLSRFCVNDCKFWR